MPYLDPDCPLTLRDAIAELRELEANNDAVDTMPALARDLDIHDVIHAVFACTTDLPGEIRAHVWTIFGTDVSMREMHRVNAHGDHRAALAQIGHAKLLRIWMLAAGCIASTWWRARRMRQRLRKQDIPELMDRRLCDIRASLGIVLPAAQPGSGYGAIVRRISEKSAAQEVFATGRSQS